MIKNSSAGTPAFGPRLIWTSTSNRWVCGLDIETVKLISGAEVCALTVATPKKIRTKRLLNSRVYMKLFSLRPRLLERDGMLLRDMRFYGVRYALSLASRYKRFRTGEEH